MTEATNTEKSSFFRRSPQQNNILAFERLTGNGIVNAVAGSGKTTTLVDFLKLLRGQVAVAAFSTKIAAAIQVKIDNIINQIEAKITVGTCHKFGYSALRKHFPKCNLPQNKPSNSKIDYMLREFVHPEDKTQIGIPAELRRFVAKAYSQGRQWGAGVAPDFPFNSKERWLDLVDHFSLEDEFALDLNGKLPPDVKELVKVGLRYTVWLIKWGVELCETGMHDFEDMMYVPLRLNLVLWQYSWVLIDECQDLNVTRRMIIAKMLKPNGRCIFVGDPHQAIFGFTGADAKSFENIRKEFNCIDLPLTWCFRCGTDIVAYSHQWVSHIEASPTAHKGEVLTIDEKDLFEQKLTPGKNGSGDAVICRNNAPLVPVFFQCMRKGIAAHIEGKDLGEGLITLIDRFKSIKTFVALKDKLEAHKDRLIKKSEQNPDKFAILIQKTTDEVDTIVAIMENLPQGSVVTDLKAKIKSMFQDENGDAAPTVTLTSSHKSKGLEYDRVFWYGKNRFNPSPFAKKDWQIEQENNLCYVTATRAINTLVIVNVPIPALKKRF